MSRSPVAYARDAAKYDSRTSAFARYRRKVVDALPLRRGDTVIDAGCGTGLCFAELQERIGPDGVVVGVDTAPEMLEVAAERVAAAGWSNVVLACDPLEKAELPTADHALFCAVHDILQSARAVDNVLAHLRPGAAVAAGGGKWGPAWAVGLNASVLALHAPYVQDFAGFGKPWAHLADRVTGLDVRELAMGTGYVAAGRVAQPPPR
jgi:SAM-dependent methyltransferase